MAFVLEEFPKTFSLSRECRLLSVDPGVHTGVNTLVDNVIHAFQLECHGRDEEWEVAGWICDQVVLLHIDALIVEDFVLIPNAPGGGRDGLSAERLISSLWSVRRERYLSVPVFTQMPALKDQITDERLARGYGIDYGKGNRTKWRHAADASRHLVQYLRRHSA